MKVLALAEFDPAGVLTGHRAALRALGVDYRLAVLDLYGFPVDPDWILRGPGKRGDLEELRSFARDVDVTIFNPGIGQPWSYTDLCPTFLDGALSPEWVDLDPKGVHVSLFHGSRNAAANAHSYAAYWRGRGHKLWATTLDYVHWLEAEYVPPAVRDPFPLQAPLRADDDPLVIAHAPTDPGNCHTSTFLEVCRNTGAVSELITGRPHEEVMRRKARCSAGFDHLRGSFSVNTIENCALGLAPMVSLRREFKASLKPSELIKVPSFLSLLSIHNKEELLSFVKRLEKSPENTRSLQIKARETYKNFWTPEVVGEDIKDMLEAL